MKSLWKENAPERINRLQMDCLQETLDEIAELVGYKPMHTNEFSGDNLVKIIKNLVKVPTISLDGRKRLIDFHRKELNSLLSNCPHHLKSYTKSEIESSKFAVCDICGDDLGGWRCNESPDSICHYFTEPNEHGRLGVTLLTGEFYPLMEGYDCKYEGQSCIFCNQPEERK